MTRRRALRSLGVVGTLGALAVAVRLLWPRALEPEHALATLRSVQDLWWAWPAFFGAYLSLTWAFVPVTLFHMVSGAVLGFRTALIVNLVAFNLTSSLQFAFGRRMLRARGQAPVPAGRLGRIEKFLERDGLRAVLLCRLLPLPNMAVNLAAGASNLRWRDFALGSLLGAGPIIAIYTWFAAALAEGLAGARQDALVHSALAGVVIAVLAVGSRWLGRRKAPPPD